MLAHTTDGTWTVTCNTCRSSSLVGLRIEDVAKAIAEHDWLEDLPPHGQPRHLCRHCRVRSLLGDDAEAVPLE